MKAVFFDIDGTLFIEKQGVPASTVEAITKIRENGELISEEYREDGIFIKAYI